jgi:hypothetical protein
MLKQQDFDMLDHVTREHVRTEWVRIVRKMHRGAVVDPAFVKDVVAFFAEVGVPPRWDATVKRISVHGDYVIGNLRWSLPFEKWRKPYTRTKPAPKRGPYGPRTKDFYDV